jgi:hypothetical protein
VAPGRIGMMLCSRSNLAGHVTFGTWPKVVAPRTIGSCRIRLAGDLSRRSTASSLRLALPPSWEFHPTPLASNSFGHYVKTRTE